MQEKNALGTDTAHNEEEWYEGEWGKKVGLFLFLMPLKQDMHKPRERRRKQ